MDGAPHIRARVSTGVAEARVSDTMSDKPTDLAAVAASVAKALDLVPDQYFPNWVIERCLQPRGLNLDGSNLTDPYWFQRCVLWLQKRGDVMFRCDECQAQTSIYLKHTLSIHVAGVPNIRISCPPEEFPARAVAALETKGE